MPKGRPILRVFPTRTSFTPEDNYVWIGDPGAFGQPPPPYSEIHICCRFTWERERCEELREQWARREVNAIIKIGGPGYSTNPGVFVPGKYVKFGVSFSSRGCPNRCPWCLVPQIEGPLRLLPICPGNRVQDNNILAWPRDHFLRLCAMLRTQRGIVLAGGLEARRLAAWHVDALRSIPQSAFRELWFAADSDSAVKPLHRALDMVRPAFRHLSDNGRRKLRCFVLIGYGDETIETAERRLENVWEAGALPFAQIYRAHDGLPRKAADPTWRALQRKWARPAAMYATHREAE